MNTFETMKHNIPEGATHYRDESDDFRFSWVMFDDGGALKVYTTALNWCRFNHSKFEDKVKPIPKIPTETPEEKEALDAIEQVEWNGKGLPPVGVECEFMCEGFWGDSHYHWCIFLGLLSDGSYAIEFNHPTSPKRVTCQCFDPQCTKFRKLETPEEKKERERIESAKHLYSKHCKEVRHPVKDLDNNSVLLNAWLVIVDETGYRKSLNDVNGKG